MRRFLVRAVVAGSLASLASTAVSSLVARRRTGSLASAPNATSHWVWGERAKRRHAPDLRHTLLGYAIHHASAIWWAGFHEAGIDRTRIPPWLLAPAVSTVALTVDYRVVPKRLTPGFERHMSRTGLATVYVACSAGLALGSWLARGLRPAQRRRGPPPRA